MTLDERVETIERAVSQVTQRLDLLEAAQTLFDSKLSSTKDHRLDAFLARFDAIEQRQRWIDDRLDQLIK
jgi:hypothetical protein